MLNPDNYMLYTEFLWCFVWTSHSSNSSIKDKTGRSCTTTVLQTWTCIFLCVFGLQLLLQCKDLKKVSNFKLRIPNQIHFIQDFQEGLKSFRNSQQNPCGQGTFPARCTCPDGISYTPSIRFAECLYK